MTTQSPPRVVVPCQNVKCLTREGTRHVLMVITTDYALIEETCRYCKTPNRRVVMDGIVLESRRK